MKRLFWTGIAAACLLTLTATSVQAASIIEWNGTSVARSWNGTIGARILVGGSDVEISELGVHDLGQNGIPAAGIYVAIWEDATATVVAQGTVPQGATLEADGYRYVSLGSTVTLSANTHYVIGAYAGIEGFVDTDQAAPAGDSAFSGANGVTFIQNRFAAGTAKPTNDGAGTLGRWCAATAKIAPPGGDIAWSGLSTSGVTTSNALAQATLAVDGGSDAVVTLYWDTTDKGEGGAWSYSNALGTTATGLVQNVLISNLLASTSYSYRFYGTNATFRTEAWSAAGSFLTDSATVLPPTVINSPAVSAGIGTTTLSGTVTATNGAPISAARIYWGTSDGGATHGWEHTNVISGPVVLAVAFSTNLAGLTYGVQYYYRAYASNSAGSAWSADTTLFLTAPPFAAPDGAEAYYSFDDSGAVTTDDTGNGYTGAAVGTAAYIADGKLGGGLDLSGGDNKMTVAGGVPIGAEWTVAAWYYDLTGINGQTLFRGSSEHHVVADGSEQLATYVSTGWRYASPTVTLADEAAWHHIVAVGTGTVTRFYVDGVEGGANTAYKSTQAVVGIGGNQVSGQRWADTIDEVYIYDRALSASEVSRLYRVTANRPASLTNLPVTVKTPTSATLEAIFTNGLDSVYYINAWYWTNGAPSSNVVAASYCEDIAGSNISVSISGLAESTIYYYTFQATNAATSIWAAAALSVDIPVDGQITWMDLGESSISDTSALAQATLSVYSGSNADVTVYWDTTDQGEGGPWANTNALGLTTTGLVQNVLLSNLTAETVYSYRFYAANALFGTEGWSFADSFNTALPSDAGPSNLTATAGGPGWITLSWQESFSTETGFAIERGPSASGPWVRVGTAGAGATEYLDSDGLAAETAYSYRVTATNAFSFSKVSNIAGAMTPASVALIEWLGIGDNWRSNGYATVGSAFTVGAAPIMISHLGVHDQNGDGLAVATEVGLWDASSNLVASVTVPAGTLGMLADHYRYEPLPTSVQLQPETSYVIGAFVGDGREPFQDTEGAYRINGATLDQSRFDVWPAGSFAYPDSDGGIAATRWAPANALIAFGKPGTLLLIR